MADKINDEELVAELERYGETVKLPIKKDKRPILIKKLNHLRLKHRPEDRPPTRSNRRYTLDVLSSDDSEPETTRETERKKTKTAQAVDMVNRSLRQRSILTPVVDSGADNLTRRSLRSRKPKNVESPTRKIKKLNESNKQNTLYPDLNLLNESTYSLGDRDETFESSDDDYLFEQNADTSSFEVQNKSVNTTFTIESNSSRIETNTPHRYDPNESYSSPLLQNRSTPKRKTNTSHQSPKTRVGKKQSKKNYPEHVRVSCGIVIFLAVFFVIVATGYIFIHKETIKAWIPLGSSAKQGRRDKYLLCPDKSSQDCYEQEEVTKAIDVINKLFDFLSQRKGEVYCGKVDPTAEVNMSREKFEDFLKKLGYSGKERLMNSCLDHIIVNPHWKIRAVDKDGNPVSQKHQVEFLEATDAAMSFFCRLWRSFSEVVFSLLVLLLIGVALFLILKYIRWRIAANEKEQHQVYSMVEDIIDILKNHYDLTLQDEGKHLEPYLALQHVRDQLLPPHTRAEMLPIWDKAVKFIEANESRIRLEEQTIQGEEFVVWRWIHTSHNGNRVWQGQAFGEHNESGNNSMIFSPTPCLKIRNMFDADVENDADWHLSIQDAILEKCRNVNSILHIYVDKNSKEGCVYMKCSSCLAAGNARLALHGWWFDGRLVTARYLKLDHYHNRFPESVNAVNPLVPSTDEMTSLSQPYYRSILEMT